MGLPEERKQDTHTHTHTRMDILDQFAETGFFGIKTCPAGVMVTVDAKITPAWSTVGTDILVLEILRDMYTAIAGICEASQSYLKRYQLVPRFVELVGTCDTSERLVYRLIEKFSDFETLKRALRLVALIAAECELLWQKDTRGLDAWAGTARDVFCAHVPDVDTEKSRKASQAKDCRKGLGSPQPSARNMRTALQETGAPLLKRLLESRKRNVFVMQELQECSHFTGMLTMSGLSNTPCESKQ